MSFFTNLIGLIYKHTRPVIPVVECTTVTMEFKEGGKRQFVYHKLLDTVEICDILNAIFEEHEGLEIEGDIEVFKYEKSDDMETQSTDYLPIRE